MLARRTICLWVGEAAQRSARAYASGPRFVGVYSVETEEVDARALHTLPDVLPPNVLASPRLLHDFLVGVPVDTLRLVRLVRGDKTEPKALPGSTNKDPASDAAAVAVRPENGSTLATLNATQSAYAARLSELPRVRRWDTPANAAASHGPTDADWELGGPRRTALDEELALAAALGDAARVEELLAKGANPNTQAPRHGAAPMHLAVDASSLPTIAALLQGGANVNIAASNRATPLHWAARTGHVGVVEALVKAGADVNATTLTWRTDSVFGRGSGQTPLHWAAEASQMDAVLLLLQLGAHAVAEDEAGRQAHDVAKENVKRVLEHEVQSGLFTALRFTARAGAASEESAMGRK